MCFCLIFQTKSSVIPKGSWLMRNGTFFILYELSRGVRLLFDILREKYIKIRLMRKLRRLICRSIMGNSTLHFLHHHTKSLSIFRLLNNTTKIILIYTEHVKILLELIAFLSYSMVHTSLTFFIVNLTRLTPQQ